MMGKVQCLTSQGFSGLDSHSLGGHEDSLETRLAVAGELRTRRKKFTLRHGFILFKKKKIVNMVW